MIFWNFGYDGGIISGLFGMQQFAKQFATVEVDGVPTLNAYDLSLITAVPNAGALLAIPISAFGADRWGRKMMVYIGCIISLLGAAIQVAANSIAVYVVGRAIICMTFRPGTTRKSTNKYQSLLSSSSFL